MPSTEVQMERWHQVVALNNFGLYLEVGKCKVGHQVGKHSVYLEVPSYTWRCTWTLDRCTCSLYLEVRRKKRTKAHKTKLEAA